MSEPLQLQDIMQLQGEYKVILMQAGLSEELSHKLAQKLAQKLIGKLEEKHDK